MLGKAIADATSRPPHEALAVIVALVTVVLSAGGGGILARFVWLGPALKALGGVVDYVVGAKPGPGVYVLGTHDDPKQKHYLNLYKLGEGPLYCVYTPYHLCHFEVPNTIARVALFADAVDEGVEPGEVDPVLQRNMEGVLLDRAVLVGIRPQALDQLGDDLAVVDLLLHDLGLDLHRPARRAIGGVAGRFLRHRAMFAIPAPLPGR